MLEEERGLVNSCIYGRLFPFLLHIPPRFPAYLCIFELVSAMLVLIFLLPKYSLCLLFWLICSFLFRNGVSFILMLYYFVVRIYIASVSFIPSRFRIRLLYISLRCLLFISLYVGYKSYDEIFQYSCSVSVSCQIFHSSLCCRLSKQCSSFGNTVHLVLLIIVQSNYFLLHFFPVNHFIIIVIFLSIHLSLYLQVIFLLCCENINLPPSCSGMLCFSKLFSFSNNFLLFFIFLLISKEISALCSQK